MDDLDTKNAYPTDPPAGENQEADSGEEIPAAYEFELPEGFDPGRHLEDFKDLARKMGLSHGIARELVGFWVNVAADAESEREDAWKTARREWAYMTARDPEIGGSRLPETVHLAQRVINTYGTEGLKELFRVTGLGNHPEVVRFFARVGRAMGEDGFHEGPPAAAGGRKTAAELIYGRQ